MKTKSDDDHHNICYNGIYLKLNLTQPKDQVTEYNKFSIHKDRILVQSL